MLTMYYIVILCSGYRTVSLSLAWQQIAALTRHACRECLARSAAPRSPTTSSAVSWTVLHCLRTLGMTGLERAKRAVWTRIGHAPALIDRVRACVN
jgi:hypothetical protein